MVLRYFLKLLIAYVRILNTLSIEYYIFDLKNNYYEQTLL